VKFSKIGSDTLGGYRISSTANAELDRGGGMKKKLFCGFLMFSLFSSAWAGETILKDDFSNGLEEWELFGSPKPQVLKEVFGREYVFDNNGDGWCDSGVVSKTLIKDVRNIRIDSDVYLQVDDYGGCWVEIALGVTKKEWATTGACAYDNYLWYRIGGFSMVGDACWAENPEVRRHSYLRIPGGQELDFLADEYVNGWHRLTVEIDDKYYVSIAVDGQLIGKSEVPIPEEWRKNVYLLLGSRSSGYGGKAYMDNISVEKTEFNQDLCLSEDFIASLPSGWDSIGVACDIDESQFSSLFTGVRLVWLWDNDKKLWKFWSPDEDLRDKASIFGIEALRKISKYSAIWIFKD